MDDFVVSFGDRISRICLGLEGKRKEIFEDISTCI
jgi:hypothetical protein